MLEDALATVGADRPQRAGYEARLAEAKGVQAEIGDTATSDEVSRLLLQLKIKKGVKVAQAAVGSKLADAKAAYQQHQQMYQEGRVSGAGTASATPSVARVDSPPAAVSSDTEPELEAQFEAEGEPEALVELTGQKAIDANADTRDAMDAAAAGDADQIDEPVGPAGALDF